MTLLSLNSLLVGVVAVVVVYGAYVALGIRTARIISEPLVREAKPFRLEDPALMRHILVLGDSTAVGVGSVAELSVAGRLSQYLGATVENYAVSGATTADLPEQRTRAQRTTYDLVLIQVGANDVMDFHSLDAAAEKLASLLQGLRPLTSHIVVLTAGDIGKAPVFKWPLSWIVSYRTVLLRERFIEVCRREGAAYVDIYSEPDLISMDVKRYHAADGLHLSADGYGYWYELVIKTLARWPELSSAERQA